MRVKLDGMPHIVSIINFEGITATYNIYYKEGVRRDLNLEDIFSKLVHFLAMSYTKDSSIEDVRTAEIDFLYKNLGDPMYIELNKHKRNIRRRLDALDNNIFGEVK